MFRAVRIRCSDWVVTCGVSVVVFCATVALPTIAYGADDKALARQHYETATRLYEVREYVRALDEYKAAYVAKPDPAFLFNIGQCLRKLDRNNEALDFFQQYLKKAPPDDPNRELVEARIRNIRAGLNSDYDPFDKSGSSKSAPPPVASPKPAPVAPPAVEARPVPSPAMPAAIPAVIPATMPAAPAPPPPPAAPPVAYAPVAQASDRIPAVDLTSRAPGGEEPAPTPVLRTWWFWTGLGAVLVAGTITAVALLSGGGGTNIPQSTLGARSLP